LIFSCARSFKPIHPLNNADIIQIASLAFVKCYPRFNPEKSEFSTFVYNCMKNAIISELKKHKRSNKIKQDDEAINKAVDLATEVDIEEFLPDSISQSEKTLILMLRDGYDAKEIQDILGITKKEFKQLKMKVFKRIIKCQ
jgi:RNA polymerase sigma factor (sigma-70 family)